MKKIKFIALAAVSFLAAQIQSLAAPLAATAAIHAKPDESSTILSYMSAGKEPVPAPQAQATAPEGWMAVELPGPFEAYVHGKDMTKTLDIAPGATLHQRPNTEAAVIATYEKDDKFKFTGLARGKWMQIMLEKPLIAYLRLNSASSATKAPVAVAAAPVAQAQATPTSSAPAPKPAPAKAPEPMSPSPVAPAAYGMSGAGQAAPMVNLGDGGSSSLPRSFQGKFASSHRAFAPKRPFPYQLNDDAGVRFAYLDLTRLMLTDSLEKYTDRAVAVFGIAKNFPGTRDIVIEVESLQLLGTK